MTAGRRSVSGFSAYSRLFFFSSRGIGLLPGVPWEDDLAASAGDLRDGRRRGLRDGDPHCPRYAKASPAAVAKVSGAGGEVVLPGEDRKSTRLNSSHSQISYAVFC